ncbi:AAA family ATPase [Pseudodesulfovibrio cashew]|uniref:AAA family ATPase n=1 Tax=Pseudodesulfovibrio cashew TaxID=2678688 RepID=A0A6I6JCZ4_9BACT|nr:AAA family ATPase [Pseudodesulfovibrio cashew]QGY38930.1 AAA family ATPase [Pseudodesulfovibrio cashew]
MSQLIRRREALSHCDLFERSDYRILLVQAQAGQGKTVLATQFDEASRTPFAWTTCSSATNSPRLLFEKVLHGLSTTLSGFSSDALSEALQQQLVNPEFVGIASASLGGALEKSARPVILVFDDVHLLKSGDHTLDLLKALVETTPSFVKFIFISRYPLAMDGKPLFPSSELMQIDKSLLAFSREEIALLYNDVLGEPAGTKKIRQLYEATEGWISGLKLLHTSGTIRRLVHADTASLGFYFDELLLPSLTPAEYREMARLALLEELPEALLRSNVDPAVVAWINELVDKNCFVRVLKGEGAKVFRLHHIFQEYLARQADDLLTDQERAEFLSRVGDWCIANDREKEGLLYYTQAEDWPRMAEAMRTHCLPLLALNHHHLLMTVLDAVPDDIVKATPWLSFAYGVTRMLLDPARCEPALRRAIDLFRGEDDGFGELLASCSLLNFQFLISGAFERNNQLLERAILLFEALRGGLPAPIVVSCAQAIAVGMAHYRGDFETGREYARISDELTPHGDTSKIWATIVYTLILALKGDVEAALELLSPYFVQSNSQWLSFATRFSTSIIEVNYLLMAGRVTEYKLLSAELRREWKDVLRNSYLGVFLDVWDLDVLLSEERHEEMVTLCERTLADQDALSPHIVSQLLHYEMMAHAHLGRWDAMERSMRRALRIRSNAGGPYFVHLTLSLSACALSLAGRERPATRLVHRSGKVLDGALEPYQGKVAQSYLAALYLRNGETDKARELTRLMLGRMRQCGNRYFFGWSPRVMRPVLSFAVREGIHAGFARGLARERLASDILDDGTLVPFMHVHVLAGTKLVLGDEAISGRSLSPAWREIIAMLAVEPGHELDVQDVQCRLWPDEDPADSRSKFDTMLSRLRSRLTKVFGRDAVKRHIQLKAQRLSLLHCLFDIGKVAHYAEEGIAYAEKGGSWQAHAAFSCMEHWLGAALARDMDRRGLSDALSRMLLRALGDWLEILIKANMREKALAIADMALVLEPVNDTLHRQRYNLLSALGRPSEAALALRKYREILREHDFGAEEIDDIIDSLLHDG